MSQAQKSLFGWPRPVLAWILYDFASSSYILLIPGVAYAVYYRQVVCGGTAQCDARWAVLTSTALVLAGLLAPLLGAIADLGALRHRLFVLTTLLCCGATAALYWVQPGALWWGGLLFVVAQFGYILAASLYDAFLPAVSPASQMEQLSSIGWGVGLIGGLLCFALVYGWLQGGLAPENLATYRQTFLLVAGFYGVVAIPAIAWLPRSSGPAKIRQPMRLVRQAYHQVFHTLSHRRKLPQAFRFLLGYYLISDGIVTLNSFFTIHLTTVFGLEMAQILQLIVLFNAIAIPATIGVGMLSRHWHGQTLLPWLIGIWVVLLLLLAWGTQPWIPAVTTILIGLVIGSTQSICRGLYAQLIPPEQVGEMFGFHALVSKLSAVLGPLTYGFISATTDNQRLAIFSLVIFIVAGGWIVLRVPIDSHHLGKPDSV